ncbi:tail fiber [Streptomyces phage Enygma]
MTDIIFPGLLAGGPIGQDYLPANYDLVLYKGDYLPFAVTLKDADGPINLTGYTAKCSIKSTTDSNTSYDATCVISPTEGKVEITFPSSVTSTIPAGEYVWDFQVTNSDENVRTYFAGDVVVYAEVTR